MAQPISRTDITSAAALTQFSATKGSVHEKILHNPKHARSFWHTTYQPYTPFAMGAEVISETGSAQMKETSFKVTRTGDLVTMASLQFDMPGIANILSRSNTQGVAEEFTAKLSGAYPDATTTFMERDIFCMWFQWYCDKNQWELKTESVAAISSSVANSPGDALDTEMTLVAMLKYGELAGKLEKVKQALGRWSQICRGVTRMDEKITGSTPRGHLGRRAYYKGINGTNQYDFTKPLDSTYVDNTKWAQCEIIADDEMYEKCLSNGAYVAPARWRLTQPHWVNGVGFAAIERCQFQIGQQAIATVWSDFMFMWNELNYDPKRDPGREFAGMHGDDATCRLKSMQFQRINTILPFWFFRDFPDHWQHAFPILAITFHNVRIKCEMMPFDRLLVNGAQVGNVSVPQVVGGDEAEDPCHANYLLLWREQDGYKFSIGDQTEKRTQIQTQPTGRCNAFTRVRTSEGSYDTMREATRGRHVALLKPGTAKSGESYDTFSEIVNKYPERHAEVNYVFLGQKERDHFAKKATSKLISQTQRVSASRSDFTSDTFGQFDLYLNAPCSELLWYYQTDDFKSKQRWFEFAYNDPITGKPRHPVVDQQLSFNNHKRWYNTDSDYFARHQPFLHHSRVPTGKHGGLFYNYSFALYPEKSTPSGAANFGRLQKVTMSVRPSTHIWQLASESNRDGMNLARNDGKQNLTKVMYARGHNVLRWSRGMGGLLFQYS